jgi:hypothetical protein
LSFATNAEFHDLRTLVEKDVLELFKRLQVTATMTEFRQHPGSSFRRTPDAGRTNCIVFVGSTLASVTSILHNRRFISSRFPNGFFRSEKVGVVSYVVSTHLFGEG